MDTVREYVRKNTMQIRKRLASADQKIEERFKLREYFYSKLKFALLHNYKTCKKQNKVILTEESIDEIARKVEHNIFRSTTSSKFNLNYKFMAAEKITEIDKNSVAKELCPTLSRNDDINNKEKDRKSEVDLKISNLSASLEHNSVMSRNYKESKENMCDSEKEWVNDANKSLCFNSFEYSSDMISKFSDSICSIEDRTKDLNESDLNNINLSLNADKGLQNNIANLKQNGTFNSKQNTMSNTEQVVILNEEPTEISENKAFNNADKRNGTDQNSKSIMSDTSTDKAQETFSVNQNEVLDSKETEVLYKKETELPVQHKSLKIILRDCAEYGENFELMDQIEYGVMNFEDPDPDISEKENESEDEPIDFSGHNNDEFIDVDDIRPRNVANLNGDDANDNEVGCSPCKKLKISKPSPRDLENIEEETLNMLRPIIDRYLSTLYIPNYYYYKHIFRCIHEDILRKKLYDPVKVRKYAIKKIKSKKYYNYMHEMIGGKYHYIPREVDDYMLSPELHSYEYRVLPI